ncbi:UPF0001 protein ML0919 [Arthrobacter sp. Hiyo4]|nr:UPF0001 protein ML0919 [Arthrobacter sp. Hiyo4]
MTEGAAEDNAERMADLAERLAAVQRRIDAAVQDAGRAGEVPTLIVVTKFHPAADIRRLAALGVRDVGENRDQEASSKAAELAGLGFHWHFVGQLQSKKAKSVVKYAHALHSVDRLALVDGLERAIAAEQERTAGETWTASSRSASTTTPARIAAASPRRRYHSWPSGWRLRQDWNWRALWPSPHWAPVLSRRLKSWQPSLRPW